ncbi:methionine--tRNA ligase, partial [Coprococcus eutactus]|nr:methionine--tRNA ligase [Coprococcus eutactus]
SFGKNNVKQLVSGIKGTYSAEDMVGKNVVAIVNLKPCKLAVVISEGMLLCGAEPEGNLSLLTTEKDFPG